MTTAIYKPASKFSDKIKPLSAINGGIKPLEREGWQATVYIACGLFKITNHLGLHMSGPDVKALHNSGHEIGDHSFNHIDGMQTPLTEFWADIDRNQNTLSRLNLPPSTSFAYPYGETTAALKHTLGMRFTGLRGIHSGVERGKCDLNQIRSSRLYADESFNGLLGQINSLKKTPGWLTIFTHDIRDNPSDFGCTSEQFEIVIKAVKDSGAQVVPITTAIENLKGSS